MASSRRDWESQFDNTFPGNYPLSDNRHRDDQDYEHISFGLNKAQLLENRDEDGFNEFDSGFDSMLNTTWEGPVDEDQVQELVRTHGEYQQPSEGEPIGDTEEMVEHGPRTDENRMVEQRRRSPMSDQDERFQPGPWSALFRNPNFAASDHPSYNPSNSGSDLRQEQGQMDDHAETADHEWEEFSEWTGITADTGVNARYSQPIPGEARRPTTARESLYDSDAISDPPTERREPNFQETGVSNAQRHSPTSDPYLQTRTRYLRRETTVPNRRPYSTLRLQRAIREHFDSMARVNAENPRSRRKKRYRIASALQIQVYEDTLRSCHGPTRDDFALDPNGTKTPWNERIAVLFIHDFRESSRHADISAVDDDRALRDRFFTMLKNILSRIRQHHREERDPYQQSSRSDSTSERARRQRRYTLRLRRIRAADCWIHLDSSLKTLQDLLLILPQQCHSEDESDHAGGQRRYRVTRIAWRNPNLGALFRLLDKLHIATRFKPSGRTTKGNWPHPRRPSNHAEENNRHPPIGLPENCYHPVYLASLNEWDTTRLRMLEPMKVKLSAKLLRFAERYNLALANPGDGPLDEDDPSLTTYDQSTVDVL